MLSAFTAGLLLITISELGDKTFFIAVILAMRHSRRWVFAGVVAALAAMTVLSVLMGQVVSFLPDRYIKFGEIALFLGFGLKLLYDASKMSGGAGCDEAEEAMETVKDSKLCQTPSSNITTVLSQAFLLTFVAEWGDRTQIATIALGASQNPYGVTVGAILGHAICALIAVVGGKLIAGRISEKAITGIGGLLFLVFGAIAIFEAVRV